MDRRRPGISRDALIWRLRKAGIGVRVAALGLAATVLLALGLLSVGVVLKKIQPAPKNDRVVAHSADTYEELAASPTRSAFSPQLPV